MNPLLDQILVLALIAGSLVYWLWPKKKKCAGCKLKKP